MRLLDGARAALLYAAFLVAVHFALTARTCPVRPPRPLPPPCSRRRRESCRAAATASQSRFNDECFQEAPRQSPSFSSSSLSGAPALTVEPAFDEKEDLALREFVFGADDREPDTFVATPFGGAGPLDGLAPYGLVTDGPEPYEAFMASPM